MNQRYPSVPTTAALCLSWLLVIPTGIAIGQDTIVLRDLTLLSDVQVESLSIDGMTLRDDRFYSWSEVQQASVGSRQADVDKYLQQIGLPLFRIRQRMRSRDFGSLQPFADQLHSQLADENGETAYLTLAALLQSKLHNGHRQQALLPLLRLLKIRQDDPARYEVYDRETGLAFGAAGVCRNLLPIWFDTRQARNTIASIDAQSELQPAIAGGAGRVYYLSLRIAAGHKNVIVSQAAQWQAVLSAQSEFFAGDYQKVIERLSLGNGNFPAEQQAIALYYAGLSQRELRPRDADSNELQLPVDPTWAITLLQIPASYRKIFPEVSAAAVYQVVTEAVSERDMYRSLIEELTSEYPQTYFGKRYRSEHKID